jgi:hypothetical protein
MTTCRFLVSLIAFLCLFTATASGQQALPRPTMLAIYPAGGKAGESFDVQITENFELEEATGLIFSHPGITAKPVMTEPDRFYPEPRPVANNFLVTIAPDTPPGVYEVRATENAAISNARRFVVGTAPEAFEQEDNNSIDKATPVEVGSTVNGLFAADYDYFRFAAKQGQRLIIDCWAERIDSRGDAVLMLLDANGRELARNQDAIGRDPMIDFTATADGEYLVRVHDLLFTSAGGTNTAPYRISISTGPWIDFIQPPVAPRDRPTEFTIFGRNLGEAASDVTIDGRTLEKITATLTPTADPAQTNLPPDLVLAPFEASADFFTYRHKTADGVSNPVRIALCDDELTNEVEPNDKLDQPQLVQTPLSLLGRFDRAGDIDGFVFEAKKDDKLWMEVTSQRFGQATDPLLVVQQLTENNEGVVTARDLNVSDDQPVPGNFRIRLNSTDPSYLLTAPADGRYRVLVRDQFSGSSAWPSFYKLSIREPQPDFRVVAVPGLELGTNNNNNAQLQPRACVVRRGGATDMVLNVYRQEGFDGEIEVRPESLPPGVLAEPVIIGPDSMLGSLLIRAAADAKAWAGPLRLLARAKFDGSELVRRVQGVELLWNSPNNNNDSTPVRLTEHIEVSVDDGMQLPGRLETPEPMLRMARGGKLEVPVKLVKQTDELKGNVTVGVVGLPQRINQNNPGVAPDGEGKLQLDLQQDVVAGRYTVFLRGEADIQQFRRRPELEDRAKEDRERIIKVQQELEQEYQKSTQARQKAEQEFQQATQQQNNANNEKNRLAQVAAQAKPPSEQAVAEAAAAEKKYQEAVEKTKQAELAKQNAMEAETKARQDRDQGNQVRQQAEQALQQASNITRQRAIKAPIYSAPLTLEIVPYPCDVKLSSDRLTIRAGEESELAVIVKRDFDFKDELTFAIQPPAGVGGWSLSQNAKIERDKNDGKFALRIDQNAPPGQYEAELIIRMQFNGRTLEQRLPIHLKIEPKLPSQ